MTGSEEFSFQDEGDWQQQQECERERWEKNAEALIECRRKGVSEDNLKQLSAECGIDYRFITDEVRITARA